jgi:hypothetical protein
MDAFDGWINLQRLADHLKVQLPRVLEHASVY